MRCCASVEAKRCSGDRGAEKSVGKTMESVLKIEQGGSARRAEEEHAKTSCCLKKGSLC